MRHLILRICCLLLLITSIGVIPPQTAQAAGDLTRRSFCRLNTTLVTWGGGSALHANGLLYVAKSISPMSSITTKSYIAVFAIDPESAGSISNGGDTTCNVVAVYNDASDNYTRYSVLLNPSVLASDSQGNIYVGRGSAGYFRMLYIPASATISTPFAGLVAKNVPYGIQKNSYTYSAMAVTDDYAVVSMSGWNPGEIFDIRYGILPMSSIQNSGPLQINATWNSLGTGNGPLDSFVGMPNGKFFLSGGVVRGGGVQVIGAAFLNPANGALTNPFNQSLSGVGTIDCRAVGLGFSNIFGCVSPTAVMGADDNLYFTAHIIERSGSGRGNVAWRYNIATNEWKGLGNLPKPTLIPYLNNLECYGGMEIAADADGNVMAAMNGEFGTKETRLALLRDGVWSEGRPNYQYAAFGRPNIDVITVGGDPRVSLIYTVMNGSYNTLWWATYSAPLNVVSSRCKPSVVLESGSYFINKTAASGTIYTAASCTATRYVAVASTSATPPTTVNSSDIKPFSKDNGNFTVNGLATGINYIHVRLYDTTNALESWVTNSVYVDNDNAVAATVAINNGNSIPNYKDTWNMRASTYTAKGYTRSLIGSLNITGVTDNSGLMSYAINDQPAVNFDTNNINLPIPVNFNNITSTVGITLTLIDGAGNSEVRGIRPLTYDVTPPTVSAAPTATFTSASDVFSGTIGLSSGTITDDVYSASGRQYWGVWVANAKCSGDGSTCPADTASQLRWGAVPVTDPTAISWNLLNGMSQAPESGLYRTYIRFLDGAGNASTTAVTVDTTITVTPSKVFMPLAFSQR